MKSTPIPERYVELDVFRALAIMVVVLYHYTTRYNGLYGHVEMAFSFRGGHYGVEFFFMISGFAIYMSMENIRSGRDFIVKRFSRLYPAYWASVGITFTVVSLFSLPGREVSLVDAVINLTMLQDFLNRSLPDVWIGRVASVDGVYWTLSRFISFYMIMFLIHRLKLRNKIVPIAVGWLILICLSKWTPMMPIIELVLLIKEASYFIIGIMFYLLSREGDNPLYYYVILLSICSAYITNGKMHCIAALLFSFIFFLFYKKRLKFIGIKPLIWLGGVSYSLYLIHQNVGYVIMNSLKSQGAGFFSMLTISIAVSIFIAAFLTRFVERPLLKKIRSVHIHPDEIKETASAGSPDNLI